MILANHGVDSMHKLRPLRLLARRNACEKDVEVAAQDIHS
jgi:hypothetical protein